MIEYAYCPDCDDYVSMQAGMRFANTETAEIIVDAVCESCGFEFKGTLEVGADE